MAGITLEIKGLDEVNKKIANLIASDVRAGSQALYEEAETIMTAAKRRTPVLTNALRTSGHVRVLDDMVIQLGFGGPAGAGNHPRTNAETNKTDVGYALVQHESMEYDHTKGAKGGGVTQIGEPKFLERAFLEALPGMAARVARTMQQIRAKLGGG